ncbi:MAG: hypothetical protein HC837_03745 [Chloroflexaceae bacterium]|nr:hypothetical protein [Chloroflexaceae bacterium]
MRILPNYSKFRIIAIACWVIGAWWIIQPGQLDTMTPMLLLNIAIVLLGILLLAIGVAFWQLATDRKAGVVFDTKGVMLNLGHSSAFVSWDTIADVGVCRHRNNVLSLGSTHQLGLQLNQLESYIQSYEERLPASRGVMAGALRSIYHLIHSWSKHQSAPTLADLRQTRERTGYDILVPETFLGGKAEVIADLIEQHRSNPRQRRRIIQQLQRAYMILQPMA